MSDQKATYWNLDQLAAEAAQEMINQARKAGIKKSTEILERLVTKALGVLQEQGIYACMLFLYSRSGDEKKIAPTVRKALINIAEKTELFGNVPNNDNQNATLKFFSGTVASKLHHLLLIRDLYEQTLIYARYHAKAADKSDNS